MSDWTLPEKLGKYDLISPLGQGGMGVVWRARQADLGRDVAIKVMLSGEHASEEMLQRFQREARLAAKLQDPGIVHVFDYGNEGRLHYFVMELVEGQSLKELLAKGPLPVDRAVRIAVEAAKALGAAHDMGVVHRDVKPGNLLIDTKGRVRVADFGLAKDLSDASLTATGAVVGTPSYMAPEQAAGEISRISPRTDVYALGAVLYEMLTGRPPFTGTALAVLRQIDSQPPTLVSKLNPAVPAAVVEVVMQALAKEPERRFANGRELGMALENPSSMSPTMVRPAAAKKRAAAPGRSAVSPSRPAPAPKRPWWLWGGLAAAVVLVGIALFGNKVKMPYQAPVASPGPPASTPPGPTTPAPTTPTPPGPVNPPQPGHVDPAPPGPVDPPQPGPKNPPDPGPVDPPRVPVDPPQPPPKNPPDPGPVATAHLGLRKILDRLAKDPLRWAAAGAMPLPTEEEIRSAKEEEPDSNCKDLLEALRLIYAGRTDEAVDKAGMAWERAPSVEAALVRGEILLLKHRWTGEDEPLADALDMFKKITPPEPDDLMVLHAIVLISRQDEDGARKACAALLEKADSARFHLLEALRRQGLYRGGDEGGEHLAAASAEVEKAKKIDPTLDDHGYGAFLDWFAAFGTRKYDGMDEQVLLEHTKERPWPLTHLLRAWVRLYHSDWKGAAAEMQSYDELRPRLWPALEPSELHALAEAGTLSARQAYAGILSFLWLGRWDDAVAAASRGVEKSSEIGKAERDAFLCDIEYQLARAYQGKGEFDSAFQHLEGCLAQGGRRDRFENSTDFDTLRADRRWREALDKAK